MSAVVDDAGTARTSGHRSAPEVIDVEPAERHPERPDEEYDGQAGDGYDGTDVDGAAHEEAAYQEAAYDGAEHHGVDHDGVDHDGADYDGADYDGADYDGADYDGAGYDDEYEAGHDGADEVVHDEAAGGYAEGYDAYEDDVEHGHAVEGDPEPAVAAPVAHDQARVVQDTTAPTRAELRVDFGAHLEANYRRLVAQLYAITLDPAEAHAVVQDAYSRAWRSWTAISRSPDPTGWVRRVAVRSTIRSWRRWRRSRRRPVGGSDTRTTALLTALGQLPPAERRCVVLHHMAGSPVREIAAVEGVSVGTTVARLNRAQQIVTNGLAAVLADGLEPADPVAPDRWAAPAWDEHATAAPGADDDEEGLR